jgi:DeoR/GlpR family transcriptional regulator of sugar metabolism
MARKSSAKKRETLETATVSVTETSGSNVKNTSPETVPSARQAEVFWRRRYLRDIVSRVGKLPYSTLKEAVQNWREAHHRDRGELAPQAISDDIAFWNNLGVQLRSVSATGPDADKRERWIVDQGDPHVRSKDPRSTLHQHQKQAIADAAMGMICGFGYGDPMQPQVDAQAVPSNFKDCYTWEEIEAELTKRARAGGADAVAKHVCGRLQAMYAEENRSLAFDAGTTNDRTIDYIAQLDLPTNFSRLAHLTVCTNSRGMFQKLGEPPVRTRVIMIGGEQRWRTEVVAGRLAELFIRSSGLLHFAITFVGATILDLTHYHVCSDSQEEAQLKSLLFERSALRVVCADSSKWQTHPMRTTFPFARLNPKQFDLIITSEPAPPENPTKAEQAEYEQLRAAFAEAIPKVESQGIPVFITQPRALRQRKRDAAQPGAEREGANSAR